MYVEVLEKEIKSVLHSYGRIDFHNRIALVANLTYLYHCMKASENLLKVASSQEHSEVLANYYAEHAGEEKDHNTWLRKDLTDAGLDPEYTTIPSTVVEMVGGLYYLVYHVEPAAVLGYLLLMEGNPIPMEVVEELEQLHGNSLMRTVRYHAEHDPEHLDQLRMVIENLPEHRKWIVSQTAVKSAHYFGRGLTGAFSYGRLQ